MRVSRGIAVLSVTAMAVLGLTACSSDDDTATTGSEQSAGQTEETTEEESSKELTTEDFIDRVTAAQAAAGTVTVAMSTEAAGEAMTVTGDMRYLKDTTEMRLVTEVPETGSVEILLVGGMFYINMGDLTQGKYVQVDPNDASNPLASSFAPLMDELDPKATTERLAGALVSVEKSGEPEEMDGVEVQPYTVVVDGAKVAASMGADASTVPAEITYTYWIGEDDLMRQIAVDQDGATIDMAFSNWGEELDITAPTADQLTEMPF